MLPKDLELKGAFISSDSNDHEKRQRQSTKAVHTPSPCIKNVVTIPIPTSLDTLPTNLLKVTNHHPSETESDIHAPEPSNPSGPPSPEPENIPIPATPLEEIELIDWWHSDEQWSTPYDNHPEDYHSSVSSAPSDYFDYYQAERDDEEFREANERFVRNELSRIAYEHIRNLSNPLLLRRPPL